MTDQAGGKDQEGVMTVVEQAFPGNEAPPELSVGIVSLVELCQLAMPDPAALAHAIENAGFGVGPQETADEVGAWLALDQRVFSFAVRNLRHRLWGRERHEAPVMLLLSEGESDEGPVVFVSTLFSGAAEADAIKAAAHVSNKQPLNGAQAVNKQGAKLRRVFWDVGGVDHIRGLLVSGPQNVDSFTGMRAITAFNLVSKRTA